MLQVLGDLALIFRDTLIPVFVLMGLGFLLQRRLGLEMRTMARLNLYLFIPALLVRALAESGLPLAAAGRIAAFVVGHGLVMFGIAWLWTRARGYSATFAAAFICAILFYNSGNFGLPLMVLIYGEDSPVIGLQAIVIAVQNLSSYGVGQVIIRGPVVGRRRAVLEYFRFPFVYALILGLVLGNTGYHLPPFLWKPIDLAADGLIPVQLVTLGAQLAQVHWRGYFRPVTAAIGIRLILAPLVTLLLLLLLGWHGVSAQHLMIATAVPTALSTVLLAIEFDGEPEFAAQEVFASTVFSGVTVAVVIYLAQRVFPA